MHRLENFLEQTSGLKMSSDVSTKLASLREFANDNTFVGEYKVYEENFERHRTKVDKER